MNTYESMKLRDELLKLGFNYIDVEDKDSYKNLDFYIVNTCSVTKIADKKSRQMLHLAKKINPNVKVIAIGCMVESLFVGMDNDNQIVRCDSVVEKNSENATKWSIFRSPLDGVDYVIPNKEKFRLTELLLSLVGSDDAVHVVHGDGAKTRDIVGVSTNRIRAFIKIQDGCNQYCTYCIIPFLRGNIKSRNNEDIIEEIKDKVKSGVKEIVLTGIHLSSFGLDRVNKTYESDGAIEIAREELLTIMSQIAEIDGVERIRLGSLEPRIIDENFLKHLIGMNVTHAFQDDSVGPNFRTLLSTKFCANFCLSLQSGCDKTLKRMNRHYTTSEYESVCELIRKFMSYATITTDVIVGFPGETEEDFKESLSFVKRMRFYNPNIFPYSRRQGTKADLMSGQLTNEEKHERSIHMIEECEKISKEVESEYFEKYGDRANDVLIEEYVEEDGKKYGIGYTKEYIKCKVLTD